MLFSRKPKPDLPADIGGVRVRESTRAKRMALRVDAAAGDVVLTWPSRKKFTPAAQKTAQAFIDENRHWIAAQRKTIIRPAPFTAGDLVTVFGAPYVIVHRAGRGLTRLEDGQLVVHGAPEHLPRRVRDFLKKEALRICTQASVEKSARLGLKPPAVRVIDPKTRWGSCGPDGKIMYSWRLVLAPPEVLDYVVAHEVAHRIHLNHSRKFWALCLSLCENGAASRRWLKKNGAQLMAFE